MNAGRALDKSADDRSGRVDAVDCARGLALIGMAVYHLCWDLAAFHFAPDYLPFTPPMRFLSHSVAIVFLALVGVSLALAHRNGLNLRAFSRRLAIIGAAAALVTVASLIFAPGQSIFFGILHCIALASLLAAPFVAAPAWMSLLAGATAIALPLFVQSKLFDQPALLWIGLGEALPNTVDWYPLLPWAGVVLLGLGLSRLPGVISRLTLPGRWRAASGAGRVVSFAGRHSLAIYLLHQIIFYNLVKAAAASGLFPTFPPPKPDFSAFLVDCGRTCAAKGRAAADCESACQCVADAIEHSGEADRLATLDAASRAELKELADACMGR